ncbi:unnamed protein product [Didymodactylos carnosus]|uniref:Uncharacterized protein n=1 Tax=Didymodactylos carnosus TaxID=1234261 RepID=A0A816CHK3_9BILA|nr:unnamed protein product [Didymodactylos carnosus]CAF4515492.1 unnamed protein product [Didymodactylos carnosus]
MEKKKGQKLNAGQKQKRLERAEALKRRFADGRHPRILFTDEKFFTIEEAHNPQRDRIWADERPTEEELIVQRQMTPKGVMV